MQQLLSYLTSQSINPIALYDFQSNSSISLNSSTLSISNLINTNQYTLTSTNSSEHPINTNQGLYFNNTKYIYLSNTTILDTNSYSIIFLTINSKLGNLLNISNIATNLNIRYQLENNNVDKISSLNQHINTNNYLSSNWIDENIVNNNLMFSYISHDIKYGLSNYNNQSTISSHSELENIINFSKSNISISNTIDSLVIGNNPSLGGYGNNDSDFILNKLLIVKGILSINQVNDVIELIKRWYLEFNIEQLVKDILVLQGYSLNKLESVFSLVVSNLIWNQLSNNQWNDMSISDWNSIS